MHTRCWRNHPPKTKLPAYTPFYIGTQKVRETVLLELLWCRSMLIEFRMLDTFFISWINLLSIYYVFLSIYNHSFFKITLKFLLFPMWTYKSFCSVKWQFRILSGVCVCRICVGLAFLIIWILTRWLFLFHYSALFNFSIKSGDYLHIRPPIFIYSDFLVLMLLR